MCIISVHKKIWRVRVNRHIHSAHTSSVTFLFCRFSLLETMENFLLMSSCLAFRASPLGSVCVELSFPGCRGSVLPVTGGGGTENFLAMLCRTQHALIMLDFLSREPSCAKPSCIKHLKRLFIMPSVVHTMLSIFAWASLKRASLSFAGSDTGVRTCLLKL